MYMAYLPSDVFSLTALCPPSAYSFDHSLQR